MEGSYEGEEVHVSALSPEGVCVLAPASEFGKSATEAS